MPQKSVTAKLLEIKIKLKYDAANTMLHCEDDVLTIRLISPPTEDLISPQKAILFTHIILIKSISIPGCSNEICGIVQGG